MTDKKRETVKSAASLSIVAEDKTEGDTKADVKTTEVVKIKHWISAVKSGNEDDIQKSVAATLNSILKKHGLDNYLTLLLHDPKDSIVSYHSDKLYNAASQAAKNKDILLIIHSDGGSIEPAYLISKTLKYFANKKFIVAVPRRAKSAATLICLGAHEIHMGMISQLGPIDPQIGGLPALGLVNALDTLVGLACRFPDASKMLSTYLEAKLDLRILGYFNRVTESAVQYGERLLMGKTLPQPPKNIADHLVNHYKDHSFVIDIDEAKTLLGDTVIKAETKEYAAADEIFKFFEFFKFVLSKEQNKRFWYCGDVESGLTLADLQKS